MAIYVCRSVGMERGGLIAILAAGQGREITGIGRGLPALTGGV